MKILVEECSYDPAVGRACKFASVQAVNVRLGVPAPVLPGWGRFEGRKGHGLGRPDARDVRT